MIPSLVAGELREALIEFLSTTFALADDEARAELARFLADPVDGIFRGPYLHVRTPFRSVDLETWHNPLDWLPEGFAPYVHQAEAFERLSSRDHDPQPTIVTTGTGSGKTEAFLVPILDHCIRAQAAGQPGIKALLLYPMNALATDQARRLARTLHNDEALAGITAGIYIGGQGAGHTRMGEDHLIDDRSAIRTNPPDILLTNYKMLDFLLLRPQDRDLWVAPKDGPALRYVVLDEFHTYDGAQGTDVAMLLRRLGVTTGCAAPGQPIGTITPVATSATLGSGTDTSAALRTFAEKVFGTAFDDESVIGESVQTATEACGDTDYTLPVPDVDEILEIPPDDDDALAALVTGHPGPFNPVSLGETLRHHIFTWAVLSAASDRPHEWFDAVEGFIKHVPNWGRAFHKDPERVADALGRYLALLSIGRRAGVDPGGDTRPLFAIQVQLWVREVSRLLRTVTVDPAFRWADGTAAAPESVAAHSAAATVAAPDDTDGQTAAPLEAPSVYCVHCGRAGWLATVTEVDGRLHFTTDGYGLSLRNRRLTRAVIRATTEEQDVHHLDPATGDFVATAGKATIPVLVTVDEEAAKKGRCPSCEQTNAIRFLGSRVASLASVCITQLFGSERVNAEERKLLAFTDSVQDASHRAAFFAGRTYRFNLRSQMAEIIDQHEQIRLDDLGRELIDASQADPKKLYALTPPDLAHHPDITPLWRGEPGKDGLDLLAKRLTFEAAEELTFRNHIGRTLELTRTEVATPDSEPLAALADLVAEAHAQLTGQQVLDRTVPGYGVYVRGLIERLRLRGAVFHPWLDAYVKEDGNNWRIWGGRADGMRPFPVGVSRPIFTTVGTSAHFDTVGGKPGGVTWFIDWAVRCLGIPAADAGQLNARAFALLAAEGLVAQRTGKHKTPVYGLEASRIVVATIDTERVDEAMVRCEVCLNRHVVDPDRRDDWVGTPCLRHRCPGVYSPAPPEQSNYYRTMYRSGMRRVVTDEHTGLLTRTQRERVETLFKDGSEPVAPNVLACTPTMELGIDIGDLSAVLLTSVPRNTASYLQRVGRAGRLSGNAFIAAVVPTEPRSLYYLTDPTQMIAGDVRPPSCYLDAVEILQRQYLAYLIDRTATGQITTPDMPHDIAPVARNGLDTGTWLATLIDTSTGDPGHVAAFCGMFADHISEASRTALEAFAAHGLALAVKSALESWNAEYNELSRRRDRLKATIDKLEATGHLEDADQRELKGLKGERHATVSLMRERRSEYALSALERLGLLPNYSLGDDTTQLHASLWSVTNDGDGDRFHTESYDYARSASLALREFAPFNSFYVQGHKLVIDALDIGTPTDTAYQWWRLCPECGYGAPENAQVSWATCPRCGLASIADTAARHHLLRLTRAYSSDSEEHARVFDETDERDRQSYAMTATVDVDPIDVDKAWRHHDVTFGMELANRATIRSVNLGPNDRPGEKTRVGGEEVTATRFVTCRWCGAVEGVHKPDEIRHRGWCQVRSGSRVLETDRPALYHQVTTEAVRLLLPVSTFEVAERLASFRAALLLGLRIDFGGEPEHLQVVTSEYPGSDGPDASEAGRRRMLVVHDTVPGGTGYLARLADPDRLGKILTAARDLLAACTCAGEGRQACHRCLLGVTPSRDIPLVSRTLALGQLNELLATWEFDQIKTVTELGVADVEESELERRFKAALRQWGSRTDGVQVTVSADINGRERLDIRFGAGAEATQWQIREQRDLFTHPPTRPDFLITRVGGDAPEIAVYTDGYRYHAAPDGARVGDDAHKRRGVRGSGRLVWSLTWDDVTAFDEAIAAPTPKPVPRRPLLAGQAKSVAQAVHKTSATGGPGFDVAGTNPMNQLLEFLADPDVAGWQQLALSTIAGLASSTTRVLARRADLAEVIEAALQGQDTTPSAVANDQADALVARASTANGLAVIAVLDTREAIGGPNAQRWTVLLALADDKADLAAQGAKARWHDWLQWSNLVQFLTGDREAFVSVTSEAGAIDPGDFAVVPSSIEDDTTAVEDPTDGTGGLSPEAVEELDMILDPGVHDLVEAVLRRGAQVPIGGWEADSGGHGWPVEAAWPDAKIAAFEDDPAESGTKALTWLQAQGWDARSVADWTEDQLFDALVDDRGKDDD